MESCTVSTSAREIPDADWQRLGGGGYCGLNWLAAVEESGIIDVTARHISLGPREKIRTLAPCYIQRGEMLYTVGDRFISGKAKRLLQRIGISLEPGLYCYSPLTPHTRLLSGEDPITRADAAGLAAAMEGICAKEKIGIFGFPYMTRPGGALADVLAELGFFSMGFLPNAFLDLEWDSFDGYLRHMQAKSRNAYKTIRRELNRNRSAGIRVEVEDDYDLHAEALSRLAGNLFARYSRAPKRLPAGFFSTLKKNVGDQALVLAAYRRDRMVGFSLFVKDGHEWNFFVSGFEYGETEGTMTYFNLVFYVPIELAIREGVRRINYGVATYLPKLRRGCRLEPISMFVKCRTAAKKAIFFPASRLAERRYAFKG